MLFTPNPKFGNVVKDDTWSLFMNFMTTMKVADVYQGKDIL
jgi:hypothetical protein